MDSKSTAECHVLSLHACGQLSAYYALYVIRTRVGVAVTDARFAVFRAEIALFRRPNCLHAKVINSDIDARGPLYVQAMNYDVERRPLLSRPRPTS